jgi:hypothetical protein
MQAESSGSVNKLSYNATTIMPNSVITRHEFVLHERSSTL